MNTTPSRRDLLRWGGLAAGTAVLGVGSRAATGTSPRRFVQINFEGGWDSAFATDPVVGSKRTANIYDPVYLTDELTPRAVAGKPQLVLGPGLIPGEGAFARLPTAFVNGIFMEVVAHDFASQYMKSGRLSLSNSRDFPALPALLGAASTTFPPHVVLGSAVPLGDTRLTSPPLLAGSLDALAGMVTGPSGALLPPGVLADSFDPELITDAHALIDTLDGLTYARLPRPYQRGLDLWRSSSQRIEEIYALELGTSLTPSAEDAARYGFTPGIGDYGPESQLAAVWLLLKSNLCQYLTVTFGSFDTHGNHLATQLPLMQRSALALDVLVGDLLATPDPQAPGLSLAETTTLLITSEFVRTPTFNSYGGTEHWQSASAILMGRGVNDGAVLGATGDDAVALGWDPVRAEVASEPLLPDHLMATVLANVGTEELADTVSPIRLEGLFVS